jgi:hypothetical protein
MLVPGMLGVGALGLAGWIWRARGNSVARDGGKEERNR